MDQLKKFTETRFTVSTAGAIRLAVATELLRISESSLRRVDKHIKSHHEGWILIGDIGANNINGRTVIISETTSEPYSVPPSESVSWKTGGEIISIPDWGREYINSIVNKEANVLKPIKTWKDYDALISFKEEMGENVRTLKKARDSWREVLLPFFTDNEWSDKNEKVVFTLKRSSRKGFTVNGSTKRTIKVI